MRERFVVAPLVEHKVGEVFICNVRGTPKQVVTYPAQKSTVCTGCIFQNSGRILCMTENKIIGPCDSTDRTDQKDVIFKEVIPDQFELMRTIICRLALEWVKAHPGRGKFYQGVYIITKGLYPIEMSIIRNSPANILKNKDNLTPFWDKLRELINKRMKPITVKDMIEYLGTLPPDYELHCFNDGEPIRVKDSTTDHEKKIVELQFE
jgi:hypothetical protein